MAILDRFRIDDRVAIVTGASSGLGVAFAAALADAGADVSLGARRDDRLEATRKLVEEAGRPSPCEPTWPAPTTVISSSTPPRVPSAKSTFW
jgi:NAD(P)-dependent dehydrogenase (short-subunit alcohol dehydrogenase family)